jgi:hypothetical protein
LESYLFQVRTTLNVWIFFTGISYIDSRIGFSKSQSTTDTLSRYSIEKTAASRNIHGGGDRKRTRGGNDVPKTPLYQPLYLYALLMLLCIDKCMQQYSLMQTEYRSVHGKNIKLLHEQVLGRCSRFKYLIVYSVNSLASASIPTLHVST